MEEGNSSKDKEIHNSNNLNNHRDDQIQNTTIENKSNQVINKKRYRDDIIENAYNQELKNKIKNTNTSYNNSQDYLLKSNSKMITECPYLGTIKRHLLDFDFEKVCSISLSNSNVYACLVCGKYYQGRGKQTLAYTHSLEETHHIFINLSDQRIYTLPDGHEVVNNSLNDIKFNLKPKFSRIEIENLDENIKFSKSLDGTEYLPGCIGLNNIKKTDYFNVIIQTLCRIPSLRNFFLEYDDTTTDLVR
jgi:hypothetical protein